MLFKTCSGGAFFSDVLMGGVLEFAPSWHIVRLDSKPDIDISVVKLKKRVVGLMLTLNRLNRNLAIADLHVLGCDFNDDCMFGDVNNSKPLTGQFSFNIVIGVIVMLLAEIYW